MSAPPGDDVAAMRRALALAARGWGLVHPNPLVGAVVHDAQGRPVAEGWHEQFGGPHAEVVALDAAGAAAAGGTLFVTLEPCAHHGKTPPCTEAILRAGIRRVVYGADDPNPRARGGAEILRSHGVAVTPGVEAASVKAQNRIFFHIHERRRCYVALKLAVTLDARLGLTGERTRLTGERAYRWTHRLRAGFDAVLVGGVTARVDDPLLTVRDAPARVPPHRVVLDTAAALAPGSSLVRTVTNAPILVLCAADAPVERREALARLGVQVLAVARGERGLALDEVFSGLWKEGLRSVLCEGGGRLAASLIAARLVDRLHLLVAPRLLGERGVPAFPMPAAPALGAWSLETVERLGEDVLLEYAPGEVA